MEDEEVVAVVGRRTLDGYGRSGNDAARMGLLEVPLLHGADIGEDGEEQQDDCRREGELPYVHASGSPENEQANEHEREGEQADSCPDAQTEPVRHPMKIGEQNELMLRDNLIDGLCTRHFEVEEHFLVAWILLQGTLEPKDAVGNIVDAIVGAAQVVADIGGGILLCQLAIKFDSCLVICFRISTIGQSLRFRKARGKRNKRCKSKGKEYPDSWTDGIDAPLQFQL